MFNPWKRTSRSTNMDLSLNNILTHHVKKRSQQRGIKREAINLVMNESDYQTRTHSGCVARIITRKRANLLVQKSIIEAHLVDAVSDLVVICEGSCVLTAYKNKSRITACKKRKHYARSRKHKQFYNYILFISSFIFIF